MRLPSKRWTFKIVSFSFGGARMDRIRNEEHQRGACKVFFSFGDEARVVKRRHLDTHRRRRLDSEYIIS